MFYVFYHSHSDTENDGESHFVAQVLAKRLVLPSLILPGWSTLWLKACSQSFNNLLIQ